MKKGMLPVILCVVFILIGPPSFIDARSDDSSFEKPVVIIDAGHTNKMPGAVSITGKYEVEYNDNLVSKISNVLTGAGFVTIPTRNPNQEIKLEERVNIANSHNALAMLSIHHDSAQLVYLELIEKNGKKAYRTRKPISGYSIFVSKKNSQFDSSFIFAKLLGEELIKLGRKPTLHHAEPIPGEGRPLLDADLGIYQYDDLVVLKQSTIPAVLLEVGVIVDQTDEAYVTRLDHQESIVNAILVSLGKFKNIQKNR
ncbi:MAG: N-acetylmuramoyl-L-alanine amidase [Deltaproteobacteria bacterium]|nr:N-acetylmuramoyl-L-alanine amidase [Deltaproteobacteria bacterium]